MAVRSRARIGGHLGRRRFSRRAALAAGGGGLAAALLGAAGARSVPTTAHDATPAATPPATPVATPGAPVALADATLRAFEADVEAALRTFKVPGAAVALVHGARIAFARGFGVRDLASGAPVTDRTRFRLASNTKSMTSLLVATFVDEGVLGWDDRVVDLWPEFRAPTPELTGGVRVRDLLGTGTGIAESPTIEFFMSDGGMSALDLLRRDGGRGDQRFQRLPDVPWAGEDGG